VIAGKYRSRPLRSLPGQEIRPTADRLRETLFNVLTAGSPGALEGSIWADLYAGSGAVGIEALSRGAGKVYFVEASAGAAKLIRTNLDSLQVTGGFELMQVEAIKGLRRLEMQGVVLDYVFLDPPYNKGNEYGAALNFMSKSSVVRPAAVVIAEHGKKFDPGESFEGEGMERFRKLVQGDAALSFYRRMERRVSSPVVCSS
jgi:16S rRNA (guanine(966)-N(2))-methyltransferase RsmD